MNRSDIHAGFVSPRLLPRLSFCQDLPRLSPKTLAVGFVLPKSLTTNEAVAKRQRKIGPCLSASGQGIALIPILTLLSREWCADKALAWITRPKAHNVCMPRRFHCQNYFTEGE